MTQWFSVNHLQVNAAKTQAMSLGKSQFTYRFSVEDQIIDIEPTLKILGVTLDKDLNYKPHVDVMLKKAYAKIAALRKIKRLVPSNVMITLYKTYVLPVFWILFSITAGNFANIKQQTWKCQSLCFKINFKFRELSHSRRLSISRINDLTRAKTYWTFAYCLFPKF